jgi:hypothetical protein
MALTLVEDAFGDPRNAVFLAVAADLAYLPAAQAVEAFRTQLGLEARLISAGNTQVYVATSTEHIVVAFRGTEDPTSLEGLKDWLLSDAVNLLIVPEGRLGTDLAAAGVGARFHQGFINALASVWETLAASVEEAMRAAERPLWLTGHSLGGALALLAAWLFQRRFLGVHQVYTFGAPMVGNAEASRAFDRELQGKVYRYVNPADPVPCLPTVSLIANAYGHCAKEVPLGAAAAVTFAEILGKTASGLLSPAVIDEFWTYVVGRVEAHLMTSYRSLLERNRL